MCQVAELHGLMTIFLLWPTSQKKQFKEVNNFIYHGLFTIKSGTYVAELHMTNIAYVIFIIL